MRKRSRIALALLLLAVIGGVAWLTLRPNEPMYKGKRLSAWLEAYALATTESIQDLPSPREADEAVRHIGTNAIPLLLRRLRANDSRVTLRLVALAGKQHFFKVKFRPAWLIRPEGVRGFQALGADGKDAVPELIRMYEQDRFAESRDQVASILGGIGPAAEQAVPALARSLGDTKLHTRVSTLLALRRIHAQPEIAVPAFVKCLSDQDADVRGAAAYAIATFGSDARQAVPDLLLLLADSDVSVRTSANFALNIIEPEAAAKAGVK
ncbi:MAG: repeat-containing protein [Pedosphaera sp.]|nr:repeat-containing protein [Pedosphaera sp.]